MVPPDSDRVSRVRPYSGANLASFPFRIRGYHPLLLLFQRIQLSSSCFLTGPTTPKIESSVWALPTSLAATMGISDRFLFLCLLRCVTSAGFASYPMYSDKNDGLLLPPGSPIRIPTVNASFQLSVAFRRLARPSSPLDNQGIHQQPLAA